MRICDLPAYRDGLAQAHRRAKAEGRPAFLVVQGRAVIVTVVPTPMPGRLIKMVEPSGVERTYTSPESEANG